MAICFTVRIALGIGVALATGGCASRVDAPAPLAAPTATPIPPPAAFPTLEALRWRGGEAPQTTVQLPGKLYAIDIATHPTAGWPAIAILQRFSASTDPLMTFARVYNPRTHAWGPTLQVDVGTSSNGRDPNGSAQIGITGDDTVHVVWGSSDADGGLWTSTSRDYGTTWDAPQRIASGCTRAVDLATTADGFVVVLAMCGRLPTHPTLIVRTPAGLWQPQDMLSIPGHFGALVAFGRGDTASAVAFVTGHGSGMDTHTGYLIQRSLRDGTTTIQQRSLPQEPAYHFNQAGLAFAQTAHTPTEDGVIFTWKGQYRAAAYALVSRDGGHSWGGVEEVVQLPVPADEANPHEAAFIVPAYDPVADRAVAIWTCCDDANYAWNPATHYGSWSVPSSGVWHPSPTLPMAQRVPLVLGSRSAHFTASAQTPGSRRVWLAWVERVSTLVVRSEELNQIIPVTAYPTPTALPPSPTAGGGS